jgi:hypothetical protein
LSSTASLEGDDKDDDVNAASTPASAPHANTDADERPTVITLHLPAVTIVGLLRSAPWHSVFSCFGTNVSILPSAPGHNVFSSFVEIGDEAYQPHFSSTNANEDTLSSPASLEGDDEDDDVNAASTPASAPHANTDADERPVVLTLPLSVVTNVGLVLRSAPWHSVFTDADERPTSLHRPSLWSQTLASSCAVHLVTQSSLVSSRISMRCRLASHPLSSPLMKAMVP